MEPTTATTAISAIDQILVAAGGTAGTVGVGGIIWYCLKTINKYLDKRKLPQEESTAQSCSFDEKTKARVHEALKITDHETPDGVNTIISHHITTNSIAETQGRQTEILESLAKTQDAMNENLAEIVRRLPEK